MTFSKSSAYDILFEVSDTASELVNKKASIVIEVSTGEAYLVMQRKEGLKIPKLGIGTYPSEQTPDDVSAVYINEEWELYTHGMEIRKLIQNTVYPMILDTVYPIGSIYISLNNTNPSDIIGGTWERIEGRFLLAADSTYTAGSAGGEASVTLDVANLPKHKHNLQGNRIIKYNAGTVGVASGNDWISDENTAYQETTETGSGVAHNNMPPYLAVYMWKRIQDPGTT